MEAESKADWHGSHYVREEGDVEPDDSWGKKLIRRKRPLPRLPPSDSTSTFPQVCGPSIPVHWTWLGIILQVKNSVLYMKLTQADIGTKMDIGWILSYLLLYGHSVMSNSLRPQEYSTPGFPVLHYFLEFAQTHVHWVIPSSMDRGQTTILSSVICCSSCPQSFPESWSFPMSWHFASGGQSIGASASPSFLPINVQGWFPLGLNTLIPLLSNGLLKK